jgi:hypothetical protein
MHAKHDENKNSPDARRCTVCRTELSEEQISAGLRTCSHDCSAIEAGLSSVGLERHPKVREFLLDEIRRLEREPHSIMANYLDAWDSGTLIGTTVDAQKAAARTAKWYTEILQGPDEKGVADRVLGLRGGRGEKPALQAARDRYRDEDLFCEMIRLMSLGLNVTIEEAAKIVSSVCEELYPAAACKKWKITPSEKLARRFKRSKIGNTDSAALFSELEPMTLEDSRLYLSKFPKSSLPKRLQKFIFDPQVGR